MKDCYYFVDEIIMLSFKIAYHRCKRYYYKLRNLLRQETTWKELRITITALLIGTTIGLVILIGIIKIYETLK